MSALKLDTLFPLPASQSEHAGTIYLQMLRDALRMPRKDRRQALETCVELMVDNELYLVISDFFLKFDYLETRANIEYTEALIQQLEQEARLYLLDILQRHTSHTKRGRRRDTARDGMRIAEVLAYICNLYQIACDMLFQVLVGTDDEDETPDHDDGTTDV